MEPAAEAVACALRLISRFSCRRIFKNSGGPILPSAARIGSCAGYASYAPRHVLTAPRYSRSVISGSIRLTRRAGQ
jgi:hypothetical protein